MAGIYLHIPFCKQACHYCDFHFSTNLRLIDQVFESMIHEIHLRRDYLKNEHIETIYLGGGTPSIYSTVQIREILEEISSVFQVTESPEITLEANPDDINTEKLSGLFKAGVNRLSIGIQTFDESGLRYMNRSHSSDQASQSIKKAREAGFENITADLIYALPSGNDLSWQNDLSKLVSMGMPHISLYGLTIEEKTVFGRRVAQGKMWEVKEEVAASQYQYAIDFLKQNGYLHYEVSNFAKVGFESKHNAAYWSGKKYLGIGPGAHSYDGESRSFNINNNPKYVEALKQGILPETKEKLSLTQKINESILTGLRTSRGIDILALEKNFEIKFFDRFAKQLAMLEKQGFIRRADDFVSLTTKGFLVADDVALKLFYEN